MSRLYPAFLGGRAALALLLVRVVMGTAFIMHGWPKIQKPLEWMPAEAGMPGVLQALAAVAEFGGGIALIPGLLTPLAALGITCTMITAIATFHVPHGHPFVGPPEKPSYELAAGYLVNALLLILVGPGKISLDAFMFGRSPAQGPIIAVRS